MNQKSIFRRRFDRCGRLDRSRCAKASANVFGFALYLPNEFDASGFSGPEQNLVGAPRYSSLGSKIHLATPIRPIDASIDLLDRIDPGPGLEIELPIYLATSALYNMI